MSYSFANSMCQIWTGFVKSYSRTHATISQSLLRSFHSSRIQNATESKDQESGQEDAGKEASKDKRREYARKYYQKILNDPERLQRKRQQWRRWYAKNYPNNPTLQQKRLENVRRWRDAHRDEHVNNYLNNAAYREAYQKGNKHNKASDEKKRVRLEQNVDNCQQIMKFCQWISHTEWARRMAWETHELLWNETGKTPGLCASCKSVYTRKFWWQRKKSDEKSGEKLLDCHNCFCHKDWEKAMPIGMRGHVFGTGRIRQPDWTKYPPPSSSKS